MLQQLAIHYQSSVWDTLHIGLPSKYVMIESTVNLLMLTSPRLHLDNSTTSRMFGMEEPQLGLRCSRPILPRTIDRTISSGEKARSCYQAHPLRLSTVRQYYIHGVPLDETKPSSFYLVPRPIGVHCIIIKKHKNPKPINQSIWGRVFFHQRVWNYLVSILMYNLTINTLIIFSIDNYSITNHSNYLRIV